MSTSNIYCHVDTEQTVTDDALKYSHENFVHYCQRSVQDRDYRPYFIFTSTNRECFPDLQSSDFKKISLHLDILTKEDAHKLIKNELIAKNYKDEDVKTLAKTLDYYPLVINPAIKYINEKHKERKKSGGYSIKDYLTEIDNKIKEQPNGIKIISENLDKLLM